MHSYEAETTKRAGSSPRYLLTLVLFVTFFFQSYIAQTHIHPLPVAATKIGREIGHASVSPAKSSDHDRYPDGDDPAHCPFCQAVAATGRFLTPVLVLLPVPTFSTAVERPVSHTPSAISPPPHDWHGRGPPRD